MEGEWEGNKKGKEMGKGRGGIERERKMVRVWGMLGEGDLEGEGDGKEMEGEWEGNEKWNEMRKGKRRD